MTAALRLDDVAHCVEHGDRHRRTLAPLSRSFTPGHVHVIAGASGSGKSTLLSILSLSVRATRGSVHWGDQNLSALSPYEQTRWRRQHLGLVLQTSRHVGVMTVIEHLRLAASLRGQPDAEAEAVALLSRLGLHDKLAHLPGQLSGGEAQRVAIAQALCCRPTIVLADEPTASLDPDATGVVVDLLTRHARDHRAVVVCVSHDRALIDAADEVVMLAQP